MSAKRKPLVKVFGPVGFRISEEVEGVWMENTEVDGETVSEVLESGIDAFPSATFDGTLPDEYGYDCWNIIVKGFRAEVEYMRRVGEEKAAAEVWAPTPAERKDILEWVMRHMEVRGDGWKTMLELAELSQ